LNETKLTTTGANEPVKNESGSVRNYNVGERPRNVVDAHSTHHIETALPAQIRLRGGSRSGLFVALERPPAGMTGRLRELGV